MRDGAGQGVAPLVKGLADGAVGRPGRDSRGTGAAPSRVLAAVAFTPHGRAAMRQQPAVPAPAPPARSSGWGAEPSPSPESAPPSRPSPRSRAARQSQHARMPQVLVARPSRAPIEEVGLMQQGGELTVQPFVARGAARGRHPRASIGPEPARAKPCRRRAPTCKVFAAGLTTTTDEGRPRIATRLGAAVGGNVLHAGGARSSTPGGPSTGPLGWPAPRQGATLRGGDRGRPCSARSRRGRVRAAPVWPRHVLPMGAAHPAHCRGWESRAPSGARTHRAAEAVRREADGVERLVEPTPRDEAPFASVLAEPGAAARSAPVPVAPRARMLAAPEHLIDCPEDPRPPPPSTANRWQRWPPTGSAEARAEGEGAVRASLRGMGVSVAPCLGAGRLTGGLLVRVFGQRAPALTAPPGQRACSTGQHMGSPWACAGPQSPKTYDQPPQGAGGTGGRQRGRRTRLP